MKEDSTYVNHILSCIADVENYTQHKRETFDADSLVRNACLRQLQVMAESTMRISAEVKYNFPNIPWKDIAGFRHILVHDYLGNIDPDVVWRVIQKRLPELKSAMLEAQRSLERGKS